MKKSSLKVTSYDINEVYLGYQVLQLRCFSVAYYMISISVFVDRRAIGGLRTDWGTSCENIQMLLCSL